VNGRVLPARGNLFSRLRRKGDRPSDATHRDRPQAVVRETVCKTILNRSGLSDYSLNCYTGCTQACLDCYARFMQRFHPHPEPWGTFVDVKVNSVEVLKRQISG
jgi:DNA repair photolyase